MKDHGKETGPRVARTYKGECGICFQPILAGEAYDYRGGTNTRHRCIVHYNCYKPTNAPTWEELRQEKQRT